MTGVPPLDPAVLPPAVRDAGPAAAERFQSALGFERVLLGELLQSALPAPGDDAGPQVAQLPDTLADALVAQGGIGIGAGLFEALGPTNDAAPAAADTDDQAPSAPATSARHLEPLL